MNVKLCECGCGKPVSRVPYDRPERGYKQGDLLDDPALAIACGHMTPRIVDRATSSLIRLAVDFGDYVEDEGGYLAILYGNGTDLRQS